MGLSEQQAYAKIPDTLMKNILQTSKDKTLISKERRADLKHKITESRGKFTSFKSAISIFTRIKSQVNYIKISKDKFDGRVNNSGLTKTEQKVQDKLIGELKRKEKIARFPAAMQLKEKVFSEKDQSLKTRQYHQKDMHRKKQLNLGSDMNQLAQTNLKLLETIERDKNELITKDHISMLNDLSRKLEVHKPRPKASQAILHENINLFLKNQSRELKDLYTKVGEDLDGSKAQEYFDGLDQPLPTLGQYLAATGLDRAVEMMQFFMPK